MQAPNPILRLRAACETFYVRAAARTVRRTPRIRAIAVIQYEAVTSPSNFELSQQDAVTFLRKLPTESVDLLWSPIRRTNRWRNIGRSARRRG